MEEEPEPPIPRPVRIAPRRLDISHVLQSLDGVDLKGVEVKWGFRQTNQGLETFLPRMLLHKKTRSHPQAEVGGTVHAVCRLEMDVVESARQADEHMQFDDLAKLAERAVSLVQVGE